MNVLDEKIGVRKFHMFFYDWKVSNYQFNWSIQDFVIVSFSFSFYCYLNSSYRMSRILSVQKHTAQELRLLKFYVDGLHDEKRFDCLKKNGFLGDLSKCAAHPMSGFDKFLADIDQVGKEQKYRSKYGFALYLNKLIHCLMSIFG